MKIAIVIESFDPHAGGLERSTAQIAEELAGRGHEVTLLAGGCRDVDCLPGVKIMAMAKRKRASALRLWLFVRWVKAKLAAGGGGDEDAVGADDSGVSGGAGFDVSLSMTTAVPAAVLQPRGGTVRETLERNIAMRPTLLAQLTKRVSVWLNPKQQLLLYYERQTFADAGLAKIAAVSGYVTRQLQTHYELPTEKVELIPNAAVMPKVGPKQRAEWRERIRSSFDIADDVTVFLFAAINPRLKGFEPLMKATALLKERGVPAVVLLAGDFWHGQNRYAASLGVRDRVRFVRHTKQIQSLYAAADVTVHPTFYDPASKVVIESLMMGVPAISTAYNGASDLILPDGEAGENVRGRVIPDPADAVALADAMEALTDPVERKKCSKAAKGLDGQLSMQAHVDRLEGVLRDAAAVKASKPID